MSCFFFFFFSSRRRHTRLQGDWSSDVCSSDLGDSMAEAVCKKWLRAVIGLQCLLILAFVFRGWLLPDPLGPRLPSIQGNTVWIQSHGALHQFDRQGTRLDRKSVV